MYSYIKQYAVLLVLILLPICTFAAAGNTLRGRVTDDQGQAMPGAVISIPDLRTGTVTDTDGRYHINNLPTGNFLAEVHMLGYATITTMLHISGTVTQDFKLSQSIIEKNEVVITGTSQATDERRSIIPIQSMRLKELHEDVSTNIIDAVTKVPGVNQVSTGPAVSKPVIRGLGYNRIITLNNGVRQEGQQWGDEHGIEIDDYNVTRVEVLKGPASLAYGSDALAGVINIVSDDPIPLGKIEGNITGNFQTNNGLGAGHVQLGGNINGISLSGYLTQKEAHDYKDKYDGYVYDTRFRNTDYGFSAGINKQWGYSRLSYTSYNQHLGIAEGDRDSATGTFIKQVDQSGTAAEALVTEADGKSYSMVVPYQVINHQKIDWENNINLNNGRRLGINLGYQRNVRREFADPVAFDVPGLWLMLQTFTYDLKYYTLKVKGWQVSTGINGMVQFNTNKGSDYLVPDYSLYDGGAYGIAKKEWDKWSVSGGLRYGYRNIKSDALYLGPDHLAVKSPTADVQFSSFDRNFSNLTGSLGAGYNVSKRATLKFNIATGYRTPNIAELSANGVHEGTIRYEYGNSQLKAEQGVQADLGLTWSSDHVMVNAAIFDNYIRNFIFIYKLQAVNGGDSIPERNNDGQVPAYIYGQSNANLYGGELNVDIHPHPLDWLHLENTLSYVKGMFTNGTDSTRNLPYIPAARWQVDLRAQSKALSKHIRNVYAKAGLDINFAQNNVFSAYGTETASAGYILLDAGIGADICNKKQQTICSLSIAGQNLTDAAYQNHLSRLRYADINNVTGRQGIFGMGRNISLTLSVPLHIK